MTGDKQEQTTDATEAIVARRIQEAQAHLVAVALIYLEGNTVNVVPFLLQATSEDEARGAGLRLVHRLWPECDGYRQHNVAVGKLGHITTDVNLCEIVKDKR